LLQGVDAGGFAVGANAGTRVDRLSFDGHREDALGQLSRRPVHVSVGVCTEPDLTADLWGKRRRPIQGSEGYEMREPSHPVRNPRGLRMQAQPLVEQACAGSGRPDEKDGLQCRGHELSARVV
jgi:hypothetical protein